MSDVFVGQVWTDCNPRIRGRRIKILAVDEGRAACRVWKVRKRQGIEMMCDVRHVWISTTRFGRGYKLAWEPPRGR